MPHDPPRILLAGAAATCGMLLALAVHILGTRAGFDLAGVWYRSGDGGQLRAAIAWWLIAGAGFAGSFACVGLLRQSASPTAFARTLRFALAAAFLAILAAAGRTGGAAASASAASGVAAGLAAAGLGMLMAACGTYYALKR